MWKELGSGSQARPMARPCFGGGARRVKLRDYIVAGILSSTESSRQLMLAALRSPRF